MLTSPRKLLGQSVRFPERQGIWATPDLWPRLRQVTEPAGSQPVHLLKANVKALRHVRDALRTTGAFYEAEHIAHAGKNVSSGG